MGSNERSVREKTGVLSAKDLQSVTPPNARLERGPVAVIECVQSIPCDSCVDLCPLGAISKKSLSHPPTLDYEKCTGCGLCVAGCPGLAIFVVDRSYSPDEAIVMLPYEFLPLPEHGEEVYALDRTGKICSRGRIIKIVRMKNCTNVVSVIVKKRLAMIIRNIRNIRRRYHGKNHNMQM